MLQKRKSKLRKRRIKVQFVATVISDMFTTFYGNKRVCLTVTNSENSLLGSIGICLAALEVC